MNHELRLTDIGEGLEEAEIINWLVQVGDEVARDQPIVEVMTDKSNAELPAPAAGTIVSLGEAVGSIVHVGALLAVIEGGGASTPATPAPEADAIPEGPASAMAAPNDAVAGAPMAAQPETRAQQRRKASPSTRRAAAERGIDINTITGSGPGGRILLSDLDGPSTTASPPPMPASTGPFSAATQRSVDPAPVATPPTASADPAPGSLPEAAPVRPAPQPVVAGSEPLRGVRRAIARTMTRSWSEVPHIHAFAHIDAEPLLDFRARLKATDIPAYATLTPLAFFVAAVAKALQAYPQANASLDMQADTITSNSQINVGVAVAAPQGLVVPVLRDVAALDFPTLCSSLSQLVSRARAGNLAAEHFQHGTTTITNFGSLGGEQATPLIRPPESTILGFGSIDIRPFVIDGQVVARKTMHLVIGADHRLLDGDVTTAVLNHIASSLADPLGLVL